MIYFVIFLGLATAEPDGQKRCSKVMKSRHIKQENLLQLSVLSKSSLLGILGDLYLDTEYIPLSRLINDKHLFSSTELINCDSLACSRVSIDRSVHTARASLEQGQVVEFADVVAGTQETPECHLRFNVLDRELCDSMLASAFSNCSVQTEDFWRAVDSLEPGQYGHIALRRGAAENYTLHLVPPTSPQQTNLCRCPASIMSQQKQQLKNIELSHHIFHSGISLLDEMFEPETTNALTQMQLSCTGSSRSKINEQIFDELSPCIILINAEEFADLWNRNKLLCPDFTSLINAELCRLLKKTKRKINRRRRSNMIGRYIASVLDIVSRDEMKIAFHNTEQIVHDLNHLKGYTIATRRNEDILVNNWKKLVRKFIKVSQQQTAGLRSAANNTKTLYRLMSENHDIQKVLHRTEVNISVREVLHSTWEALQRMIKVFHQESDLMRIEQRRPNEIIVVKPQVHYKQMQFVHLSCFPNKDLKVIDVIRVFVSDGQHDTLSGKQYSQSLLDACVGDLNSPTEAGDCDPMLIPVPDSFATVQSNKTSVILFTARPLRCKVNNIDRAFEKGYTIMPLSKVHFIACGDLIEVFDTEGFSKADEELGQNVEALHVEIPDPEQDEAQQYVDRILEQLEVRPVDTDDLEVRMDKLENRTEELHDTVVFNPLHSAIGYLVFGTLILASIVCGCCVMFNRCCSPVKDCLANLCCKHGHCGHHGTRQAALAQERRWKRNANHLLLPRQSDKITSSRPLVNEVYEKCNNHTLHNMHALFAEEPIKSHPTIGMVCIILLRIRSALKTARIPRETDDYKWKYKAALLACGLHFPEGQYVKREEVTSEYIFSNLTDLFPLIRDISECETAWDSGSASWQTVGEMVDKQLNTLRLVVPQ